MRLFDTRTGSIHEFAIQHKVSLCALYKWQKKRGKLQNFNVSIRDVQHMRSRIKLLEEAIKVLHDSAILKNATLREKLTEMHRVKDLHSVHCLAFAFNVPRGTYYNDLLRAKGENAWFQQRRRLLEPMIRSIHEESHGSYGAEKIAAVMKLRGTAVDSRTVAAIMQEMGIASNRNASCKDYKTARARYKAKLRDKAARFTEDAPNKLWGCDVSEVAFMHTKLYLCVIIDVFSRKVVGWKTGGSNCTRLVKATFEKSFAERKPNPGLVFHTDRGSPNISRRFFDCLRKHQAMMSLSRPHVPTDNPVVESFFRNFKSEIIDTQRFTSLDSMLKAIARHIDIYNGLRPHGFLGNKTPNMAEAEYFAEDPTNLANSNRNRGSILWG